MVAPPGWFKLVLRLEMVEEYVGDGQNHRMVLLCRNVVQNLQHIPYSIYTKYSWQIFHIQLLLDIQCSTPA
jgi:hypothetical protein